MTKSQKYVRQLIGVSTIAITALAFAGCGASNPVPTESSTTATESGWVGAWSSAMYGPYPLGPLSALVPLPVPLYTSLFLNQEAREQSFRMVIHPTIGGERVRACLSNLLGDRPLEIVNANIAISLAGPAIRPGTAIPLSFEGQRTTTIPAGEKRCSDGADLVYSYGEDLAVSFYVPGPSGPMTWHPEAYAASFLGLPLTGDVTDSTVGLEFTQPERSWFFLSEVDVIRSDASQFAITAFGDSITDGSYGTPLLNHRYPDFLAQRIQASGIPAGVRNVGINGNAVTTIRNGGVYGESGVLRFQRDALTAGVKGVFVLLGTNDLGAGATAEDVYAGLVDLARQAHAARTCIVVSTILPRDDPSPVYNWDPVTEEPQRQALNQMLLASTEFDAVADVAKAMSLPLFPNLPNQVLFLEGLHPNSLGMLTLANAIPLEPLMPPPYGSCLR